MSNIFDVITLACRRHSTRAAAICDNIAIYIAICDIFFSHIAIQMYMGYTEIDGRIDGERRKYTKSHSACSCN